MCDKGIMECRVIGGAKVRVQDIQVDNCSEYASIRVSYGYEGCDKPASIEVVVDKRTKAWRDAK
jgi:hypothetical protein